MATTDDSSFPQPKDLGVKVWRYMGIGKFLDLLRTQDLHFSVASRLGDPLEGSVPKSMSEQALKELIAQYGSDAIQFNPPLQNAQLLKMASQTASFRREVCNNSYVSCWHMSEYESTAMWRIYCSSVESVCIQATYKKLCDVLPVDVHVGMVKYVDYSRDSFDSTNVLNPLMHKRLSFEHEREVRAVIWELPRDKYPHAPPHPLQDCISEFGARVSIPIDGFVENICLHPEAAPWFRLVVEDVVARYNKKIPVLDSALNFGPYY